MTATMKRLLQVFVALVVTGVCLASASIANDELTTITKRGTMDSNLDVIGSVVEDFAMEALNMLGPIPLGDIIGSMKALMDMNKKTDYDKLLDEMNEAIGISKTNYHADVLNVVRSGLDDISSDLVHLLTKTPRQKDKALNAAIAVVGHFTTKKGMFDPTHFRGLEFNPAIVYLYPQFYYSYILVLQYLISLTKTCKTCGCQKGKRAEELPRTVAQVTQFNQLVGLAELEKRVYGDQDCPDHWETELTEVITEAWKGVEKIVEKTISLRWNIHNFKCTYTTAGCASGTVGRWKGANLAIMAVGKRGGNCKGVHCKDNKYNWWISNDEGRKATQGWGYHSQKAVEYGADVNRLINKNLIRRTNNFLDMCPKSGKRYCGLHKRLEAFWFQPKDVTNKGQDCDSPCQDMGYTYTWCLKYPSSWEKCNPSRRRPTSFGSQWPLKVHATTELAPYCRKYPDGDCSFRL